jgi:indolepyruvate ferredoxin oxidoreductase
VPEGSRAVAGIGCHYMVTWMDRSTATFTHMGGEGVPWVGQAPFTDEKHIFANLGDGTYFHSGLLAIRQAIAAKVAPDHLQDPLQRRRGHDRRPAGGRHPERAADDAPAEGEGIKKIVIVTDAPEKYARCRGWQRSTSNRSRSATRRVGRRAARTARISRRLDPDLRPDLRHRESAGAGSAANSLIPARRAFINEAVCEGCGDCGVQSNCLAILPVETEFGRKRQIDQSACNKDFSCLKGFCPSFVTIEGGSLKKAKRLAVDDSVFGGLPEPTLPDTRRPFNILITGVGGTGVVTLGALVGMAAHIDGKGVSVLDMTGLAQKYGAVFSHLRIADQPADIHAARIATGEAHAIVGGDLVVSAGSEAVSKMLAGKTRAVVNTAETPTAEFTRNPDWQFPLSRMEERIVESCGEDNAWFFDAQQLSIRLMGDAIFANTILLGAAWQRGMIPVSLAAIEKAFELNGAADRAEPAGLPLGSARVHMNPQSMQQLATPAQASPAARRRISQNARRDRSDHRLE